MQLRITKPNEPVRLHEWNESNVEGNNVQLEAYAMLIKHGGHNGEGEVMQLDLVHDDGKTVIKTLMQHDRMKQISQQSKVAEFQKDRIAQLEEEVANLRKLAEINKASTKSKVTA